MITIKAIRKRLGWWRTDDGRWFRHCNEDGSRHGLLQSVEWCWKWKEYGPHFGFYWDGSDYNDDKKLYIAFLIGRVWLGFGESRKGSRYGFEFGRKMFYFWWNVQDSDCNAHGGKYVCAMWLDRLADFLFGHAECFTDKPSWKSHNGVVSMPEGDYPAVFQFESRVWVRRRSPFHRVRLSTSVDIPIGIPHSGKGENSWDCGEDALYGIGCSGHSIVNAAKAARECVLRDRSRYGDPERWPVTPDFRSKALSGMHP